MLVNLTPHDIVYCHVDNRMIVYPVSDSVARIEETTTSGYKLFDDKNNVWLTSNNIEYGNVTGLPEPKKGVTYIVSRVVADACRDRDDLVFPDKPTRDYNGQITSCLAFGRFL